MSQPRAVALSLVAGLFALTSTAALTGQSPARTHTVTATAASLQSPRPAEDDTPWGFFRKNLEHADSFGKWLALIFFTTMLTYLYLPRLVVGLVVVVGILALLKPAVRRSKLVRGGLVLVSVGWAALAVAGRFNDNPLGFGFLLAVTTPLGAAMMLVGAMLALLERTDRRLNQDIAALVAAAGSSRPVWPDEPPLPEVDRVATHGSHASAQLVALLETASEDPVSASPGSVHVEQQAALALCRIYGVLPTAGETVHDARSTPQENSQVIGFWRRKVSATQAHR